jgi:hypothetical protein
VLHYYIETFGHPAISALPGPIKKFLLLLFSPALFVAGCVFSY